MSSTVGCSDAFLIMSPQAQALYYRLQYEADWDGVLMSGPVVTARSMGMDASVIHELTDSGFLLDYCGQVIVSDHRVNNKRDTDKGKRSRHVAQDLIRSLVNGGDEDWGKRYELPEHAGDGTHMGPILDP